MAPSPTYDPPHVQLVQLAKEARAAGQSFEAFWQQAVRPGQTLVMTTHPKPPPGAVQWPTDQADRVSWKTAIEGSKDGWRRAYERLPASKEEAALRILAPGLERLARAGAPPARERSGIAAQAGVASAA